MFSPMPWIPSVVVGSVLLGLATLLLARRRRPTENLLLGGFLLLVGANFLAGALAEATGDARWTQAAYAALALDPFFLLAFATQHPYVRRTGGHLAALAWLAAAGVACAWLAAVRPEAIVHPLAPALAPARVLLLAGVLGLGYGLAWAASVASLRAAPSDGLVTRARWSCLAIGVVVVPRLPYVPFDELRLLPSGPGAAWILAALAGQLAIAALLALPALRRLGGTPHARADRRAVAAVAAVAAALLLLQAAVRLLGLPLNPFGLRWLAFAGLLVYAVLAHQVLRLPASGRRLIPLLGSFVVGTVVASILLASATIAAHGWWAVAIAAAAALSAAMPSAWATRALVRWAERTPEAHGHAERRLALYSAAVESALAGGAGQRLASARRHLGLSREEARVVEDLVRRSLSSARRTLQRGDEPIPGIVVERPLAAGASRVFLARRLPQGGRVVVKQLAPVADAAARRRLWIELDALRTLRHPGVPRLVDFALDPVHCIAYEYVPGRTLDQALRRGPLAPRRLLPLAKDLLATLKAVHAAGFVHGDIKPSNIVLGDDGRARLIDFGMSEVRVAPRATLSGGGRSSPTGTLEYMAPELARSGLPNPASDAFALGMVVREALTGRPARQLRGLAVYQALDRVAREPVDPDDAPARWRPFLRTALHPDPAQRLPLGRLASLLPAQPAPRPVRAVPGAVGEAAAAAAPTP